MIVLAIDSSADLISVALLRDREPLAERSLRVPRPRSEGVLAVVDGVLADAEVALDAVALFAVATGPGSFNGIRGGIATAEGLALALNRPVVGIPTLDAIAYGHIGRASSLLAVLPAGRGDYYTATYEGSLESWRRRGAYSVGPLLEALADLPADALVCGHLREDAEPVVARRGLRRAPRFAELPRALAVGALAVEWEATEGFDRAASLTPLYLRRPGITQPTKRPGALGEWAAHEQRERMTGGALSVPHGGAR